MSTLPPFFSVTLFPLASTARCRGRRRTGGAGRLWRRERRWTGRCAASRQPGRAGAVAGKQPLGRPCPHPHSRAGPGRLARAGRGAALSGGVAWRLEYTTLDANGSEVRASGLISVPQKPAGSTSPVLSYQHGTIFRDAEAPSNNAVPGEVAVVLASLGYVVVAPDYVGFGASRGTPHPYLMSTPTAAAVIDLLTASKVWRAQNQVADNGQLFITGYSEGGYATMAAHRALQASGSPHLADLRMAVVGAGPYDVQATLDGLIDLVRREQPVLGALINPGFLRNLGGSVQREVHQPGAARTHS